MVLLDEWMLLPGCQTLNIKGLVRIFTVFKQQSGTQK